VQDLPVKSCDLVLSRHWSAQLFTGLATDCSTRLEPSRRDECSYNALHKILPNFIRVAHRTQVFVDWSSQHQLFNRPGQNYCQFACYLAICTTSSGQPIAAWYILAHISNVLSQTHLPTIVSGTFCPRSRWSFDLGLLWHSSRHLSQVLHSSCKEATCKYVVAKHLLHSDGWSSYYFASWPWASTKGLSRTVWWLDCHVTCRELHRSLSKSWIDRQEKSDPSYYFSIKVTNHHLGATIDQGGRLSSRELSNMP